MQLRSKRQFFRFRDEKLDLRKRFDEITVGRYDYSNPANAVWMPLHACTRTRALVERNLS